MKERLVGKRLINFLLLLLITIGFTIVLCISKGIYADEIVSYLILDLIFFSVFIYLLEHERAAVRLSANRENDFHKTVIGFFLAALVWLCGLALPEFFKPALLPVAFLAIYSSSMLAVSSGMFFCTIICLVNSGSAYELALYAMMTVLGVIVAEKLKEPKQRKWCYAIIFSFSVMLPAVFYYLAYKEASCQILLYGVIEGICIVLTLFLLCDKMISYSREEVSDLLEDMLEENYPLAKELLKFSRTDYQHAKRVSKTAAKCAELVNADKNICAVAGFYYRIGIIHGEPLVESSIHIAQKECFPEEVTRIISEYNGELAFPSTIESAIIHMVDGLIKKLELFDSRTMSSEWNQDMVIYQTLNEFSANGLYDHSGLSMNMFLKIREYLVKEDEIL